MEGENKTTTLKKSKKKMKRGKKNEMQNMKTLEESLQRGGASFVDYVYSPNKTCN